jgi:hypothetical protein
VQIAQSEDQLDAFHPDRRTMLMVVVGLWTPGIRRLQPDGLSQGPRPMLPFWSDRPVRSLLNRVDRMAADAAAGICTELP